MNTTRFLTPLLLVPALLAIETRRDSPAFAPEAGSQVTKTVVTRTELSLEDIQASMGGQDISGMLESFEIDSTVTRTLRVVDTYHAVADGRPTRLERAFEEVGSASEVSMNNPMGGGPADNDISGSSDLEDETVFFTWDEDSEEYSVGFGEDAGGDEELLDGLEEDLDLRGFLPDGEVAVGDAWDIDLSMLRGLFAPGGKLKIVPEDDVTGGMGGNQQPTNPEEFFTDYDGEATAKLEEVDGGVAVISISIDASSSADMSAWIGDMLSNQEMPEGVGVEVEAFDIEWSFEGSGTLRWDLSGGHFESLELTGDLEQILDQAMSMDMGGGETPMEQTMTFEGTQTITFSCES